MVYADDFTIYDSSDAVKKLTEKEYLALDAEIFSELNKVRADPKSLVDALKAMVPLYTDKIFKEDGKVSIETKEGKAAVEEAIKYLESATEAKKEVPPPKLRRLDGDTDAWKTAPIIGTKAYTLTDGLTSACKDHVKDTGPFGIRGNIGKDNSDPITRIQRYGQF